MSVLGRLLLAAATSATPLLYAAEGEVVVQRAGVINVGIEGILLTGAFAATVATLRSRQPLVGVLAAALAGVAIAALLGLFALKLNANQVVVGVVIDLLAVGLTGTLYRILFGRTGVITASLPLLGGTINILTPLALVLVAGVWWLLHRTRIGLELRACGEQPVAAEASGTPVVRLRALALLFGGMMAGVGGAFLSIGDSNTFVTNMSAGRGFIALAIVTAGRWSAWGCLVAALIFGFTDALQFQGQALGLDTTYQRLIAGLHLTRQAHNLNLEHLPYQIFLALPYLVTLLILIGSSRSTAAPAALGRPYRRA
jgi:simple sugar transport system permease protein